MPNFLKELCTNKRKLNDKERIIFGKNVSAIINRKLPEKCKDPVMFTLPCIIGNKRIERAMLDFCASINVMSYSVYQTLNLSTLQDTNWIIQLADRSYVRPMGLVEDVLVKVNDLLFPLDIYILNMRTEGLNNSALVFLGRPFMKTAKTKISVDEGTLSVEIGEEIIKFNIAEAMKYPNELHALYQVDVIDSVVHDVVEEELVGTELDLVMEMDESDGEDDFVESLSEVLKPPLLDDSNYSTTHTKLLRIQAHDPLGYAMPQESKPRLIRWILLLQEFDLTIKDRKGSENLVCRSPKPIDKRKMTHPSATIFLVSIYSRCKIWPLGTLSSSTIWWLEPYP
ncbi:UNVERIFIED_CONTAM: hypothetical protein Slati_3885300 [Sesamum latifolium]|uniref:Reverse transcriptase domain-containing protein n=1 Tax=Sesamum latifolium TaxID=2727402 RepID=A0AAW2TM66_9LAMI